MRFLDPTKQARHCPRNGKRIDVLHYVTAPWRGKARIQGRFSLLVSPETDLKLSPGIAEGNGVAGGYSS